MPSKTKSKQKNAICFIALILAFSSIFTVSAFAYYQNPSASVLFHWSKQISGSYPFILVYGRNPDSGAESTRAITNLPGINGHAISVDGEEKPVYCLNPEQAAGDDYITAPSYNAARWARLTADQQDLVLRALYCGYPNTLDGSISGLPGTDIDTAEKAQHLALQCMIFNIRCNFIVKSGSGITKSTAYNNTESFDERVPAEYTNFHAAYANLFDRMNGFTPTIGIPSFATLSTDTAAAGKTIRLEYDASSGNYTATVTDTNGVLGYYNFASMNGSGIRYSVSGNMLTITATPEAAADLSSATRKGNVTSSAPDVKLTVDDVSFYVKKGSGTDNFQTMVEYVSSSTTKTYKSVYLMLQAEGSGPLEIVKASASPALTGSNGCYSLEGAQYGVYASEADANADTHRIETLTTDASGNANSSKKYALGRTLYIKELTASPGYLLDTQVYTVTIANNNKNSVSVKEVPTGDFGHLRIRKVDGEGTELKTITESSAVFKVEFFPNADGSGTAARTWYFKTADGILWLNDASYLDASQTNSDFYLDAGGTVIFPIGTVKISEVTAPTGYVRADAELVAHITQDSSGAAAAWHWATDAGGVIGYEAEGATVENKLIRGNLEIIKKDKYEEIYLSGAGFRVFDSEGNQVKEGYTDTFGKLTFKDLPYGEYTYQEFKAPKGFELDETVYPFSITEDGVTISHTRVNERRPGTIEVKKQDANGNPFAGVAFLLEYSTDEGSTWLPVFSRAADEKNITRGGCTSLGLTDGQLVTDETGKVRFTGLRADCKILYRLTETAAPEGYALMAGSLYVGTLPIETDNIYASDAEVFGSKAFVYTLIVTATNDPVFRMPETGGSGFGYLPFAMLLCAAPLTFINKKSKRKGDQTA